MPISYVPYPRDIFVLTSREVLFKTWLVDTIHSVTGQMLSVPEGRQSHGLDVLRLAETQERRDGVGIILIKVNFWAWLDRGPGHLVTENAIDLGTGFSFKIMQIDPDRVEVQAECTIALTRGYYDVLMQEIEKRWPGSRLNELAGDLLPSAVRKLSARSLRSTTKKRRGGPTPISLKEKIEMVRGWETVRAAREMNQEEYCKNIGVAPSTLRTYRREIEMLQDSDEDESPQASA